MHNALLLFLDVGATAAAALPSRLGGHRTDTAVIRAAANRSRAQPLTAPPRGAVDGQPLPAALPRPPSHIVCDSRHNCCCVRRPYRFCSGASLPAPPPPCPPALPPSTLVVVTPLPPPEARGWRTCRPVTNVSGGGLTREPVYAAASMRSKRATVHFSPPPSTPPSPRCPSLPLPRVGRKRGMATTRHTAVSGPRPIRLKFDKGGRSMPGDPGGGRRCARTDAPQFVPPPQRTRVAVDRRARHRHTRWGWRGARGGKRGGPGLKGRGGAARGAEE